MKLTRTQITTLTADEAVTLLLGRQAGGRATFGAWAFTARNGRYTTTFNTRFVTESASPTEGVREFLSRCRKEAA